MIDQSLIIQRKAADFLKIALPETPGGFVGDMNIDPEKSPLAWYVQVTAITAPAAGRQSLSLTIYARSAANSDKSRVEVDGLSDAIAGIVETGEFSDAIFDYCAVLPGGGTEYENDGIFHTVKSTYKIFIKEA